MMSGFTKDYVYYNRLAVFHEFHMLDKASEDKVMTGNTSGVKCCFNYQPKGRNASTQFY